MMIKKLVNLNEVGSLYKYNAQTHSYFIVLEIMVCRESNIVLEYAIVYSSEEKKITTIWATSFVDYHSIKIV